MTISDKTIYDALRRGGLSPAGACAMMGNMNAESALISTNVEDRCTMGDFDYTYAVDNGTYSEQNFVHDAYGYGLCQWTSWDRKANLYGVAKGEDVSIGDEKMQCDFCIYELQKDYVSLYQYLCKTNDIPEATKRICAEYERPAVNNFAVRINAAQKYYNLFGSNTHIDCTEDACPIPDLEDTQLLLSVDVRMLGKGDLGRDVFLLQAGLSDMGYDCGFPDGDFGKLTEDAVKELQRDHQLSCSGVADIPTWNIILKPR